MQRIVVGVDGSPAAQRALAWAARDARRRGANLRVVAVRDPFGDVGEVDVGEVEVGEVEVGEVEVGTSAGESGADADAVALIDGMLDLLAGDGRDLAIERVAAPGTRPVQALLGTARGAELLVLGAMADDDGASGLGSLSQQVTRGAHCPVVIVPGGRPAAN